MHARVTIGSIRIILSAKLLDGGIDFYRRDGIDTMRNGDRGVRSGSSSKNQRVVERPAAEYPIHLLVEWLSVLPGNHRLVPGTVYIDEVAIGSSRMEKNFIVWLPVR